MNGNANLSTFAEKIRDIIRDLKRLYKPGILLGVDKLF